MSIYNGFGTRQQESTYNKLLFNLTFLTQYGLSKVLNEGKLADSITLTNPKIILNILI